MFERRIALSCWTWAVTRSQSVLYSRPKNKKKNKCGSVLIQPPLQSSQCCATRAKKQQRHFLKRCQPTAFFIAVASLDAWFLRLLFMLLIPFLCVCVCVGCMYPFSYCAWCRPPFFLPCSIFLFHCVYINKEKAVSRLKWNALHPATAANDDYYYYSALEDLFFFLVPFFPQH